MSRLRHIHTPAASVCPKFRQRGFTLTELVVTLFISSIVAITFFQALQSQRGLMLSSLDKTESVQNGRAALSLIKRFVRLAGWGFAFDSNAGATMPRGLPPIGACAATDTPKNTTFADCDCGTSSEDCFNVQGDRIIADRLRVAYIDPNSFTQTTEEADLAAGTVAVRETTATLDANALAIISGTCDGYPYTELLIVASSSSSGGVTTYTVSRYEDGSEICDATGATYAVGSSFGKAMLIDFYIDRDDDASHPRLKMEQWTGTGVESTNTVAYDIDDLQIRYGMDLSSSTPDGIIDSGDWCDSMATCTFDDYTTEELTSRVIAVQVALVARAPNYKTAALYSPVPDLVALTPWNGTVRTIGDGYTRWIFRATVALRNKSL